jgi:flagellar biosynthesis/type III secretory pathway chaperone
MRTLLSLCGEQGQLLRAERVEELATLLERKQVLMERVDQLDQRAAELQRRLASEYGVRDWGKRAPTGETAQQILAARAAIQAVLQQTVAIDHENGELSRQLLLKLRNQLETLSRSAQASRAYARTDYGQGTPSIYMNRKI